MAVEGELSFISEPEGLTLQGVLGTRRVLAFRNFLSALTKGDDEPVMGELIHGEINEYGGNVLGKIGPNWRFSCDINEAGIHAMHEFVYRLTYKGTEATDVNFFADVMIEDEGDPRWMVPGLFYKHGRAADGTPNVPRFDPDPDGSDPFASNAWEFRSDRSAYPGIFCWTNRAMICMTTQEQINGHVTGVAFKSDGDTKSIGLRFPYRELPIGLDASTSDANAPRVDWLHVEPGDEVHLRFRLYFCDGSLHRYNDVLRDRYYQDARSHHCRPWIDAKHACDLAADALLDWHYDAEKATLADTCVFDRSFAVGPMHVLKPEMHAAGLSGAHCTHAMLWYGRHFERDDCIDAAVAVIDKIATGIAPAGTFWSAFDADGKWTTDAGGAIKAAEAGETSLFLARSLVHDKKIGHMHPEWEAALKSSLDFAAGRQRDDGCFGSAYDAQTGEVTDWEGAAGIAWVAAFVEGYRYFRNIDYLQAATLGGEYYARFVEDEFITGACIDAPGTPSSRDAYAALLAYVGLYHEDTNAQWLNLAKNVADWLLSFRCSYNVAFHPETITFHYDYRTRGADIAAPGRSYLHGYGLVCHPELVELGHRLGDGYYLERAHDHLHCFRQFIARYDSDFGARKGMSPAGIYHADTRQPKGNILQHTNASCAGLILYANMWDIQHGA